MSIYVIQVESLEPFKAHIPPPRDDGRYRGSIKIVLPELDVVLFSVGPPSLGMGLASKIGGPSVDVEGVDLSSEQVHAMLESSIPEFIKLYNIMQEVYPKPLLGRLEDRHGTAKRAK